MPSVPDKLSLTFLISISIPPSLPPSLAADTRGQDWPSWRGPNQDGISAETGILKAWPRGGLDELWRIDLGSGFSSFAAVEGRLYTLTETPAKRGAPGRQEAVCLDAARGEVIWRQDLERGYQERQGGDGPRATPAFRDGRVFVLGPLGALAALDAATGKPLWQRNVLEEFSAERITWGLSASPLLLSELVIVPVGAPEAPVVAFHQESGKVVWRSESDGKGDRAGYSTPHAITHRGKRQVIVFQARALVSLDPENGKLLWSHPWTTSFDVNAAAPIFDQGRLFISSGYNEGCALLELPGEEGGAPRTLWKSRVLRNKFSSSILFEGHLYGFDENRLKCVELATGKERWRQAGLGHGTLLLADRHLIVLSDGGDLVLAAAAPERYGEKARMDGVLRGSVSWTVPVLHRGVLYLRNLKEAVALRISGG